MHKCDWHVNSLGGVSPPIALKGGNKKPIARASEETCNRYPTGNHGGGWPMRSLKDRYIAPAISAFPPSMEVKLEVQVSPKRK